MHCGLFASASDPKAFGTDMRALDYQVGRENGESSYLEVLKNFYGVKKCDNEITLNDLSRHPPDTRKFLVQRHGNDIKAIGFGIGLDFEDANGELMTETQVN